ncbi:hypothetical protein FRC19_000743 [Serendipita sp. 401]|nr:hypothetical protein FRC19_000743 [Serendipita sp. 401]
MAAPGLKKVAPYWHSYATMAKQRWWGREILELVSTEFRDRSIEYYRFAIESGICCINGKSAKLGTIVRNGDRIENIVHRHEPPVTSIPVKVLQVDRERDFIVIDKPGSIPVHAVGRYYKNSLIQILQTDFGFEKVYPVNRLDRLTSGCMIMALSPLRARQITDEFVAGRVKKEYIARCQGEFPDEVVCEEPLLTVDRQMGLNIVHPEGKPAKTLFKRMFYDSRTDTSVLLCRPFTGRSHQIRVHLQFLGYPVANDPIYSNTTAFGPKLGVGGIDTTPSVERFPPLPPSALTPNATKEVISPPLLTDNEYLGKTNIMPPNEFHQEALKVLNNESNRALLPRETGEDIGYASPIPLSSEAVKIIMALRNMKDGDEDWSRWRDNVFTGRKPLVPPLPVGSWSNKPSVNEAAITARMLEGKDKNEIMTTDFLPEAEQIDQPSDEGLYCKDCYLPLHPDPDPGKLYIFLHALRYTTDLGSFETETPWWARESWDGTGWVKY